MVVIQKNNNTLTKKNINYENISNNPKIKKNNKQYMSGSHRPSLSTYFSLNLECGNSMINKNLEKKNIKDNNNKIIKVNTTRNNYINNLSLRNQHKTNDKHSKNQKYTKIESSEFSKNSSEVNILKNRTSINNKDNNRRKKIYDINKVIYIQLWWKNIFVNKKNEYKSFTVLVNSIKKYILNKPYLLIKEKSPSVQYFFYKWYNIINKKKILEQIFKNKHKIKHFKNEIKEKLYNYISPRKNINNNGQDLSKNTRKLNKNIKVLNNKKKVITISTNNNSDYSKKKEKNSISKKSKYNNNINFNINNNKKIIPYSPKINSITERHMSPLNDLNKKTKVRRTSLKNFDTSLIKKNDDKNKENKLNKLKTKNNNIKPKNRNNLKKNNGENIIEQKLNSKLDKIINHINWTSENETKSYYLENNKSEFQNPNSQYNNYILNINKKKLLFSPQHNHYTKGAKNKNERKIINDDFDLIFHNKSNKSQYNNTETFSNDINSIIKTKTNQSNSKVYENCLYSNNKNKNFGNKQKNEIFNKINLNDNKIIKNNNNIPIQKHVLLHKKQRERITINKEFSNHKKGIKSNIITDISNKPKKKTYSIISNSNYKRKIIFINENSNIYNYFQFWKDYINKRNILRKLKNVSKFLYLFNTYSKIIVLKNSIQKFVKVRKKRQLYEYIRKIIFKKIVNIMKVIYKCKKNNMKEIKLFKNNNNYRNILTYFKREKGDIINNININNYINYDDYKLHKRKTISPNLVSKISTFKSINSNQKNDFYNKPLSLTNSNSDKFLKNSRPYTCNNTNNTNNESFIEYNILKVDKNNKIKLNHELLLKKNSAYLKHGIIPNNEQKTENGVIVDQINQLKMVFNLLERHNMNKKKSYSLINCFNKWKLNSLKKIRFSERKAIAHRISEKIINLKPITSSRIMNNYYPIDDMSLKRNLSLNKMTPKIINVINVQNFNENNNYNYNFKYLPIKDIPIYSRHSYAYNKINELNSNLNNIRKKNINDNIINSNINNNKLNQTPFIVLNDNNNNNPKIIYHKKKLGSTFLNNNYNLTANNIDNFANNNHFDNLYYNLDRQGNCDSSSLLQFELNQSQILFPELTNRISNVKNNNIMNLGKTIFKDNSFKDLRTFISKEHHPERKFGFKKLNQIEEKEINFENIYNKRIYHKKQHFEGKKEKYLNNIESNSFKKDENKVNNNLIKSLNIQFGKINKGLIKKDNNNIEYENETTISEVINKKNKINNIKGQVSLKKQNFKTIYKKVMDNKEHKESTDITNEMKYKLNKSLSTKIFINIFKNIKHINKKKLNHSFEISSNIRKNYKIKKLKNNYITI